MYRYFEIYKFQILYCVLFIVTLILFRLFPNLDIDFSLLFWNSETHRFLLQNHEFSSIFNKIVILILLFVSFLITYLFIREALKYYKYRYKNVAPEGEDSYNYYVNMKALFTAIYLGLVLCIVFGLISHYVIKHIFHRSRPFMTHMFGGEYPYDKVLQIGQYCISDCSFISGHATLGFIIYAFIFIFVSNKDKIKAFIFGTIAGLLFGLIRIMMGLHFLSDVIFAGFIALLSCYVLYLFVNMVFDYLIKFHQRRGS